MKGKTTYIFAIAIAVLLLPATGTGTTFVPGNEAHDIDMAILNDDTGMFVLAWCDDTDDSARYQVLYTNGSAYGSANSFDTSAGNTCMISVSALNKTAFVIAYGDDGVGTPDWTIAAYDINNNVIVSPFDVDADIGAAFDIGICALNSTRYASVAADANDNDATYAIYNMADQILGQNDTDTSIAAGGASSQKADCSAISSSAWVFAYYDDDPDEIAYAIYSNDGVEIKPRTTIRASSLNGGVSVAGLSNGGFVAFYCEETNQRVAFNTYNSTGSSVSGETIVNASITGCNGASETKVEVTALNSTDSRFAVVYDNANTDRSYLAVYNYTGAEILPPKLLGTTDISNKAVAIAGYDPINGKQACKFHAASSPIIVAYNNQSGTNAVWETYFANGSSWNGGCADVTAPSVSISAPTNSTAGNTSVQLIFTASDAYLDACVRELDGTNSTIASCNNQTLTSLATGAHTVKVFANDTANNTNVSSATFTVDQTPPSVSIIAPTNSTTGNTSVQLIFTASDSFAVSCVRELDGTNTSITGCGNQTMSGLGTGAHNVAVFANDTVNNTASSRVRFTVDETAPSLTVQSPTNATFNTSSVPLSFAASDPNLGSCWRILDTTNASLASCANTTLTGLLAGAHNVTVFANDTAGNTKEATTVYFTVDNIAPSVSLVSPANGSVRTESSINFTFNSTDNSAVSLNCSIYIDGSLNQSNSSTANITNTNFTVTSLTHGTHNWSMSCMDAVGNTNTSGANIFTINRTPVLASLSASPSPVKGGSVITITASGIDDPNNDTLNLYCDSSEAPAAANSDCTGGATIDTIPPYNMNCTFSTAATDTTNAVFCRVYDGESYSTARNTTYTTDSTAPTTSAANVANDSAPAYFDKTNDNSTNITANGESSMSCRFSTSDLAYSSMTNDCTVSGTQATCQVTTLTQGNYNTYVSCKDSVGNEQNSTTNLDVSFTLDYTAPNTTDDALSAVQMPGYNVTITESDNIDGDPTTLYCTDTANTCTPNAAIDSGGKVQFSSRGTYYLRYNSTDDAGNQQATVSRAITINSLPVFTSASDNATAIKGGASVNVSTVSSDANSQAMTLWVCKANSANITGCSNSTNVYCTANSTANASCSFTAESDDTDHTWYAFIFDSLNESAVANSRAGAYSTDSTAPSITISSPANTTLTQNVTTAEIVLNEAGDIASYCMDSCSSNTTMTRVSSTLFTASLSGLSNAAHTITFYANDTYGNLANATQAFSADNTLNDTTAPTITVRSPVNGTYYNNTSTLLNITADEPLIIAQYSLNSTALQNLTNYSGAQWNKTITLGEGSHNITFAANDTSGNRNQGNSSMIFFFVDITAPQNGTIGFSPSSLNDTANITCHSSWTDNIRLDYGFVEHNATGPFANSTNTTFAAAAGDLNITFAANESLASVGCRFYMYDKTGNLTRTTMISASISDTTPPAAENLTYTPNITAQLDPSTAVNMTINATDARAIANATAQYRLSNETNYTTSLMTAANGTGYNGTVTFAEGNWTFRINVTDTSGNSRVTNETNISVFNDDTFSNTTTIPSIKSFVLPERNSSNLLGNLTLNNTADYNLNFTITATSAGSRVKLNGTTNTTMLIPVPRGNITTISIEANTTNLSAGLYNYSIYIEAVRNPVIGTENLSFRINIQNSAGPLIDANIDTFDSNVTLGEAADFVSSVTNLGTADASGVYLAWTIPENWTLVSGNLTRNVGTLGPGISATNSIRLRIGGTNGTYTINATANSTEGSNDTDSKAVAVGTPVTVTQTETVSSPGSGGSGGGVQIFDIGMEAPQKISINRKETAIFNVNVTNPNKLTKLSNVTLSIDGYSPVLMSITPENMDIEFNKTKQFLVEIRAPTYVEAKDYKLILKARAISVTGSQSRAIEKTSSLALTIHSINETSARENVADALKILDELNSEGVRSHLILQYIEEAKSAINGGDYERANELAKKIKETRQKLSEAQDILGQVKGKINEANFNGIEISETQKLYELALSAFEREDYGRAIDRARSALSAYPLETRGKVNYVKFAQNWWWALLITALFATYSGFLGYRKLTLALIAKRLESLRRQESALRGLIDSLKNDYFIKRSVSRTEYHKSIYEYETRLAKVKKNTIKSISKRAGMFNFQQSMQTLQGEETRVIAAIKDLQLKYFEAGSMSKTNYEKYLKMLNSERAEILRAAEIAKVRQASSEKSLAYKAFSLIRNIFNAPIKYQEKAGSLIKASAFKTLSLLPHKRSLAKKRFGYYNTKDGWNPETGQKMVHAAKIFAYKFGPLFAIAIIGTGLFFINGIKITGFAAGDTEPPGQATLALKSIEEARSAIDEMQMRGFGIERVNDTLKEAKLFYQKGNYSKATELAAAIIATKDNAILIYSQTDEFDIQLYNAERNGTNAAAARELFNEALREFRDEHYERAGQLLQQASQKLSDIESEEAQKRAMQKAEFDTFNFIRNNLLIILASAAILVIASLLLYKKMELKLAIRKLHRLEQEKEVTERMLREAQEKYFSLGNWGKSDYESAKRRYENKIINLNRRIATIKKSIPGLSTRRTR